MSLLIYCTGPLACRDFGFAVSLPASKAGGWRARPPGGPVTSRPLYYNYFSTALI